MSTKLEVKSRVLARYTIKDLDNPQIVSWLSWLHDLGM